jgi:nitrogen regulatory protein PII
MKKIIAYVNTARVHWLVGELEAVGIKEIMVTEYFSPSSQISRLELFCQDSIVETVREIVHRVGTMGSAGDHCFFVEEFDPGLPSEVAIGK